MLARELLRYCESRKGEMIETIRQLVELESPSNNKPAADRCGEFIAERFRQLGGEVKIHAQRQFGNLVQVDFSDRHPPFASRKGGAPAPADVAGTRPGIMLLGHYDTVWDAGTLASMPFRRKDGRLWGPGVFDMKAGIVIMLFAIASLQDAGGLKRQVTVLLNADEEVGSAGSRALTEALAKKSAAVLVLEPAHGPQGAVKTARKGVGDFTIRATGVAAHAGLDFEKGQSAVLELARQVERVSAFTDLKRGLTVNVGVVRGGTRTNVIAAEASAEVDVRIAKLRDAAGIERKFRSLKPFNPKCRIEVSGGINRPPMERTRGVAALYEKARAAARELGWELGEAAVGGGSDGNFTAALGVPTLDGLGAIGEGAHANHESVVIAELPRRAALVARLIGTIH